MTDYISNYSFSESDDLSIKIATFDGDTKIVLKNGEIVNPFFVGIQNSENGINKIYKDEKDIYSSHKRVLILCMKKSCNIGTPEVDNVVEKIFDAIITQDTFNKFSDYFTLHECSRKIINNKNQFSKALCLDKTICSQFNSNDIALEEREIVIPMFELKEDMAKLHIELYESSHNISSVPKILSLNNYYNSDYTPRTHKQLNQILMNLKDSNYWTLSNNCKLNMTGQFSDRSFEYKTISEDKLKRAIADKIDVTTIISNLNNNQKSQKNNGYHLEHVFKPDAFVDISSALKSQEKRTYFATVDNNNMTITKEQITQTFNMLHNERELFDLFNSLLISKEHCHMVLNNFNVLTKMESIIQKYLPLYKYLIGYAWVCFYTEECLFKTKTTKSSRYVFDIRAANKLPMFPYSLDDIHQNPYLTFLVSDKVSDIQNNCMAIGTMDDYQGSRIDTLENFVKKFNLFTSGDATKNIFDGMVWGDKYAVSGSMIPAFLQTKPYLFDLVTDKATTESQQWLTYFGHYYPDSDIDFMCNEESVFDFIDSIHNVKSIVEKNLGVQKVDVEPIKTTTVVITEHYLREKLSDIKEFTGNQNLTIAEIMANIETNIIKEYFHGVYYETKKRNNRAQRLILKARNNPLYEDYFKVASVDDLNIVIVDYEIGKDANVEKDCETCTYLNDVLTKPVSNDKNIMIFKISENIKFKLRSEKLLHCIEAFRAKSKDFFAVVGRFHLPCVRGYYNGETVYMEPSCVTANMTGINIDYKYFAGVRDPIDILLKYRSRGFGTILNSSEKQHMAYYISKLPEVSKMFGVNSTTKKETLISNIFGFKDINHDMYKIAHFHKGFTTDVYNKSDKKQIKNVGELQQIYASNLKYDANKAPVNMFKFKTIDSDGNVNPLQKWVIDACWSSVNNS